MNERKMLPEGCGYQGYEFGAGSYPDSICFGGKLYDADSGEHGADGFMYYEPAEDNPLPYVPSAIGRALLDRAQSARRGKLSGSATCREIIGSRH